MRSVNMSIHIFARILVQGFACVQYLYSCKFGQFIQVICIDLVRLSHYHLKLFGLNFKMCTFFRYRLYNNCISNKNQQYSITRKLVGNIPIRVSVYIQKSDRN